MQFVHVLTSPNVFIKKVLYRTFKLFWFPLGYTEYDNTRRNLINQSSSSSFFAPSKIFPLTKKMYYYSESQKNNR
jgi:hypothetical protein